MKRYKPLLLLLSNVLFSTSTQSKSTAAAHDLAPSSPAITAAISPAVSRSSASHYQPFLGHKHYQDTTWLKSNDLIDAEQGSVWPSHQEQLNNEFDTNSLVDGSEEDMSIKVLKRSRRSPNPDSARPYSSGRPRSIATSRYRYPVNRKRSSRIPLQHDYEPELLPEVSSYGFYEEYPKDDSYPNDLSMPVGLRQSSLFRERVNNPELSREVFMDEPLPSSFLHASVPIPYDRNTQYHRQPYGAGKHFNGYESVDNTDMNLYKDVLSELKEAKDIRNEQLKAEEAKLLRDIMDRTAAKLGLGSGGGSAELPFGTINTMIRRKRNASQVSSASPSSKSSAKLVAENHNKTNKTETKITKIPTKVTFAEYRAQLATDRRRKRSSLRDISEAISDHGDLKKREFGMRDMMKLYDNSNKNEVSPMKRQNQDELDDLLAREYFKTIARSVGNKKKKRMAYGKFVADKRSSSLDAFIDNPQMLDYMIDKIDEAEQSVASEAESDLQTSGHDGSEVLLETAMVRLDALRRMKTALVELKSLHEPQGNTPYHGPVKRLHPLMMGRTGVTQARERRMNDEDDECPALEQAVQSCEQVSILAADNDQVFVPACVRHEVCYMCGQSLGVTTESCDSFLASALTSECEVGDTMDCLTSAAKTLALVSEGDGQQQQHYNAICEPCMRTVLESRR